MVDALKILICDDSVLIRKKLKDMLREFGYTDVSEAENGETAVEMAKQARPDVVFMDIVMPKKTGIEALEEIRQFDPTIKVVMASSVGTSSKLFEAIKLGAFDFLQKPIESASVGTILDKVRNERGNA